VLDSGLGHGAFLFDVPGLAAEVGRFLRRPMAETTAPALTVRVWDLVCRHIDGVMVGSTMAALEQRGALKILAGRLDEIIFGGGAPSAVRRLDSFTDLMRREWDLPPSLASCAIRC